jgi:hypothetical protein
MILSNFEGDLHVALDHVLLCFEVAVEIICCASKPFNRLTVAR